MYTLYIFLQLQPETIQFTLIMSGSLISILLGIVGFFLKDSHDNVKALQKAVNSLEKCVITLQDYRDNNSVNCKNLHEIVDNKLAKHTENLERVNENIAVIKSKLEN
jgi:hypothetical protein